MKGPDTIITRSLQLCIESLVRGNERGSQKQFLLKVPNGEIRLNRSSADEDEFEVYMRSINAKVQQEKEMKLKKCISEIEKVLLIL